MIFLEKKLLVNVV